MVIVFIVSYLLFSTYTRFYQGALNNNFPESKNSHIFATLVDAYKSNVSFGVLNRTYSINHGTTIEIV